MKNREQDCPFDRALRILDKTLCVIRFGLLGVLLAAAIYAA